MRKDVKKFLFLGSSDEKESFFAKAQELGIIDFINPRAKTLHPIPLEVNRVVDSIKVLRGLPIAEQEENFDILDADNLINSILDLHQKSEQLQEEIRTLELEIARIGPLGDFSLEDKAYIEKEGKCKIQFFNGRPSLFQDQPIPDGLFYLASDHGMDYYMAVNDRPTAYEKMIEIKLDQSLSDLRHQLKEAKQTHHQVEHRLRGYAKYDDFLHHTLVQKLDQYNLYDAQTYIQQALGGNLFAVEGWVPVNKEKQLHDLTNSLHVVTEEIAIEPQDVVPTYLENKGFARLGEDLVHIYDTPSSVDRDPSMWVLGCFALFFAFIIGDAGYGLVYLAIALFLRYKFPHAKGGGKRFIDLFTVLSVGCIVWGTLMTSFFGMTISVDNPLRKLSLVQWLAEKKVAYSIAHQDASYQTWTKRFPELAGETDPNKFLTYVAPGDPKHEHVILYRIADNTMFELALFIGVLHLLISLLRYSTRTWSHLGWAIFLVGAYLHFSYYLNIPSFMNTVFGVDLVKGGKLGFQLMFIGIGLAWILSLIQNGWKGIFEIVTLIQIFADTLSYLRLYALALAGAIVSATVNEIASGIPLILGVLLILASHAINIVLGTMSGIIHGLRLNFLEWYHYSFEGGGKEFRPLKLLKRE